MSSRLFSIIALSLCICLTSGCATFSASRAYKVDITNKNGLVLLSLTQPFSVVKWMYHPVSSSKGVRGLNERFISTAGLMNLIRIDNAVLYPFELPAGEYEFFRWTTPEYGLYEFSVQDFSVRFTVVPGKVTYLGNLGLYTRAGNRFALRVRNEYGRDVHAFLGRYSAVSASDIVVNLMR